MRACLASSRESSSLPVLPLVRRISASRQPVRLDEVRRRELPDYIVLRLPDLSNGTLSEIVPQFGNNPLIVTGISAAKCKPKDNPIP